MGKHKHEQNYPQVNIPIFNPNTGVTIHPQNSRPQPQVNVQYNPYQ